MKKNSLEKKNIVKDTASADYIEKQTLQIGTSLGILHFFGFSSLIVYFLLSLITLGKIDAETLEYCAQVIGGIGLLVLYYFISKQKLIDEMKEFKNKKTWIDIALYFAVMMGALIIISIIITSLFPAISRTNSNEESLNTFRDKYFVLYVIFVIIVAPITEEFIFRYFIFRLASRKSIKLAFILSIFPFALIHLLSSIKTSSTLATITDPVLYLKIGETYFKMKVGALLTLPGYLIPSIILTYSAYKTKKLAVPVGVHVLNNILAAFL